MEKIINDFCALFIDGSKLTHLYLHNSIDEQFRYTEALHMAVDNCNKVRGTLVVHINSCGGNLFTAKAIINSIKSLDTVAIIEGEAASAAACIALTCKRVCVRDHATIMLHNASGGMYGKIGELKDANNCLEHIELFVESCVQGFMSMKEIDEMLKGKDYHFHYYEVINRLKKIKRLCETY